jgi:UDP-glucose 4-epimerase|tara:strand:+ start:130 stop:990 length:861 start_codon:yes stop_codon:yes gene_type:complete
MKIAVIGASGYIGSHLSSQLVNLNHCVHGYDLNLSQNNLSFVDELISYDIRQELKVSTLYDCVVLLAAKTKVQHSVTNPFSYYETNILGTKNVLNSFTTNHIIFASSGSAFNPDTSPYARSKRSAEDVIIEHGTPYTNLRFYNVSANNGFYKFDDERYHLIRRAAATANGIYNSMNIYGNDYDTIDGTCVRNYTHINDIVNGIINNIHKGPMNTPYECLGNTKGYSVKQVIDTIKDISGVDFPVFIKPRRLGDVAKSVVPESSLLFVENYNLEDQCRSALDYERPL